MSKIIFDPTSEEAKALVGKVVEGSNVYSFSKDKALGAMRLNDDNEYYYVPFIVNGIRCTFIRAIPEPTYAERQAKWENETGAKKGTKVKIYRHFREKEDGCDCVKSDLNDKRYIVGQVGEIVEFYDECVMVKMRDNYCWSCPFTALELVRETYRPFANAKEFEPHREKWLVFEDTEPKERVVWYNDYGVEVSKGNFKPYIELFKSFTFEDGSKCGVLV